MVYKEKNYCFSEEEMKDILLCLKEYKEHMKVILKKSKIGNKMLKKAYSERIDYLEMLFLNLKEIKENTDFKTGV